LSRRRKRSRAGTKPTDRLQEGIYFRPKEQAARCYRLLLLNATEDATSERLAQALAESTRMLAGLRQGQVRERAGQSDEEATLASEMFGSFRVLIGFGRRMFDEQAHERPLVRRARPDHLVYLLQDPEGPFPALPWADEERESNVGEADIALQLTADSVAAVNCAAVEVWKLVVDEELPLEPRATFTGFQRRDGRGWLEFHDGVSNMEASHRLQALEAGEDPAWMRGGTYMAFLRFRVDLAAWMSLSQTQQELLVGRDKLSGSPLVRVRHDGVEAVGVPAWGVGEQPSASERADFLDPRQTAEPLLEASHLHRANQNRASPSAPAGLRLFRQGYDFLEGIGPDGPLLGLNFVSFQRDLCVLQHVLHLPGWLGDVNFGGPLEPKDGEPPALKLLSLLAGGFYAVPPVEEPFPGAKLFI
jgi:Dyp-type peroxidase family